MTNANIGISGFSCYLPRQRIDLESWCRWNDVSWDKIQQTVGASFRMCSATEDCYSMAATAVLRIIHQFDIDPGQIGFLGFGTESSTDNSAGAVIVKGILNEQLADEGLPSLPRACEIPEFKHACLGGVYALKSAVRYLALDGHDKLAIVVCADIAEYERGSTGEPTQGAGAVAMLLESRARILSIDLHRAVSSSDYRGADFRKPFIRFQSQQPRAGGSLKDFPVFNGKFSTTCYIEETLAALGGLFEKLPEHPSAYLNRVSAAFLHRPYHRMATTGWCLAYLYSLTLGDREDQLQLAHCCEEAGVPPSEVYTELTTEHNVFDMYRRQRLSDEIYPQSLVVVKNLLRIPIEKNPHLKKVQLGLKQMRHTGNLYTAALAAWMAAGLEEALIDTTKLQAGNEILTIGYGSGDAAEIIPMVLVDQWEDNARLIRFREAFDEAVDLSQEEYEQLHDSGKLEENLLLPNNAFFGIREESSTLPFNFNGISRYHYAKA